MTVSEMSLSFFPFVSSRFGNRVRPSEHLSAVVELRLEQAPPFRRARQLRCLSFSPNRNQELLGFLEPAVTARVQ